MPERQSRIEAVFLDMGDTLITLAMPLARIYVQAVAESGGVHDDAQLARHLSAVVTETDERNRQAGFEASEAADRLYWRDFNSRLLRRLEVAEHLWDATQAELEAAFTDPANFTIYPETHAALARLRAAGYRLAVVSNWSWQLPELCARLDLAAPFEQIVTSGRVGFAKPHPGIFAHALQLMRLRPEAVVHIGDSPVADIGGARAAGIDPVLLDRGNRHTSATAPHRVADLLELVSLLESWRE